MTQVINSPTSPKQRLLVLDVLRGFALLGILIMNIQGFAMPFAAYFNPAVYGDLTGINRLVWLLSHVFADQKFMTIFSMLFGAGIIMITSKLEGRGESSLGLFMRRNFWLLIFGLVHAYLLWAGDILVAYAVCGFIVYWFRNLQPKWLILLGILALAVHAAIMTMGALSLQYAPPEISAELTADWQPPQALVDAEVAAYLGSWSQQFAARAAESASVHTGGLFLWAIWRAGGLMLIGMALYKWGVLTGRRDKRFYRRLAIVGLGIGLPLVTLGALLNMNSGFAVGFAYFGPGYQFNYWASILVSLGYIGAVTYGVQAGWLPGLQRRLAAVGRTALSNYFLQTILATSIFYGFGLGLFGGIERWGQLIIVFAIWAVQLIISPLWLKAFLFGPAEWLWRSLSYMKWQPMHIPQPERAPGV